jgi:hypothetical protein
MLQSSDGKVENWPRHAGGQITKLQFRCNGEFLEIWTTLGGHRSAAEIPLSQISVELIADKISLFVEKILSRI